LASKIALVYALKIIPEQITECADVIRLIRNSFAHDLNIDSFAKTRYTARVQQLCSQIYGKEYIKAKSESELFWGISFLAIAGLSLYVPNVQQLRERLDDPRSEAEIREENRKKFEQAIKAAAAEMPDSTEDP